MSFGNIVKLVGFFNFLHYVDVYVEFGPVSVLMSSNHMNGLVLFLPSLAVCVAHACQLERKFSRFINSVLESSLLLLLPLLCVIRLVIPLSIYFCYFAKGIL